MLDNFISPSSLLLLSVSVQLVRAERVCFESNFNQIVCKDRLPLGARVGIGIGIAAVVLLLFLCAGMARRRRVQRRNLSYITSPNYGQHHPQQQQQPQYGGSPFQPQQPQPSYQPGYPPNQAEAGGPPGYTSYAAPTGPPPKK